MSQLPPPEKFDCEGVASSVAARWQKWRRGLEYYFIAANITEPVVKKATLLHLGGIALQEIHHKITISHDSDDEGDVYLTTIKKLDEYFALTKTVVNERHLFRLMRQEEGENFEKFLCRLQLQAGKCQFSNEEDHLVDQIVEKCNSEELRKKIFYMGDEVTLEKILSEAKAIEADQPYHEDSQTPSLNNILHQIESLERSGCCRCGERTHSGASGNCPARYKTCRKCGFTGHLKIKCRTRPNIRRPRNSIIRQLTD